MSLLDVDKKQITKRIKAIIKTIEEKKHNYKTTNLIIEVLKDLDLKFEDNIHDLFEGVLDAISIVPKDYRLIIENLPKNQKTKVVDYEIVEQFKVTITKGSFNKTLAKTELNSGIVLLALTAIVENLKDQPAKS